MAAVLTLSLQPLSRQTIIYCLNFNSPFLEESVASCSSLLEEMDSFPSSNQDHAYSFPADVFHHLERELCTYEAELSCPNPQLLLMRDKDKRSHLELLTLSLEQLPSSFQGMEWYTDSPHVSYRQKEKTNGFTATNNWPMILLKYLCPSVQFTSTLSSFIASQSCCYFRGRCYQYDLPSSFSFHKSNNKNARMKTSITTNTKLSLLEKEMKTKVDRPFTYKRKWIRKARNSVSSLILSLIIGFAVFTQIMDCSNASPIASAMSPRPPTQKQTMDTIERNQKYISFEDTSSMKYSKKYQGETETLSRFGNRNNHQVMINNTLKEEDKLKEVRPSGEQMKTSVVNISSEEVEAKGHLRSSSSESSATLISYSGAGVRLKYASNGKLNLAKKRNEVERVSPGRELIDMSLALKSAEPLIVPSASSAGSTPLYQETIVPLTNGVSRESDFDDGGESSDNILSSVHLNSDEGNNENDGSVPASSNISISGLCWYYAVESEVKVGERTEVTSSYNDLSSTANPVNQIGALCNGTRNLEFTLGQISDNLASQMISFRIKDSSISVLNLSLFHRFSRLENLSVTHSNVSQIIGSCPTTLLSLNISFNVVKRIDKAVFLGFGSPYEIYEDESYDDDDEDDGEDGDLRHNNRMEFNTKVNFSVEDISSYFTPSLGSSKVNLDNTKSESVSEVPQSASTSTLHRLPQLNKFGREKPVTKKSVEGSNDQTEQRIIRQSRDVERNDKISDNHLHDLRQQRRNDKTKETFVLSAPNNKDDSHHRNNNELKEVIMTGNGKHKNDPELKAKVSKSNEELTKRGGDDCHNNKSLCKEDKHDKDNEQSGRDLLSHLEESHHYEQEEGDYLPLVDGLSTADTNTILALDVSGSNKENEIKLRGHSRAANLRKKVGSVDRRRSAKYQSGNLNAGLALEDVDLSHNKISEVPRALLELRSLKSLRLSGNQLKCDFVWEKLADWFMRSSDSDPNILKDGDDTFCGVVDDVRVFQFTVLGVLKAKKDLVETCRTVDKEICHECGLYSLNKQPGVGYNLSHESPRGNVAIALKLDCSYRNLSALPSVPPQTWQLNVSGNSIKDLGSLKDLMYENLLVLDLDSNEISTLDGLAGTPFLDKYNYLSLQNNRFSMIPSNILGSLRNMRGQGVTFLGANFIDCDCDIVKDIKPLLLENSKQIKDLKEIYCKDIKTSDGDSYKALKDVTYTDLCHREAAETNETYLYFIIIIELLLIFVIVAKVWHDRRSFRSTGRLPWFSAKMPRLPCDAILESVKEPPHFNRSSSTNVRSFACDHPTAQSISSHVQLREVRSNSGQSEKSSQISQLSAFPTSSRTSSV